MWGNQDVVVEATSTFVGAQKRFRAAALLTTCFFSVAPPAFRLTPEELNSGMVRRGQHSLTPVTTGMVGAFHHQRRSFHLPPRESLGAYSMLRQIYVGPLQRHRLVVEGEGEVAKGFGDDSFAFRHRRGENGRYSFSRLVETTPTFEETTRDGTCNSRLLMLFSCSHGSVSVVLR